MKTKAPLDPSTLTVTENRANGSQVSGHCLANKGISPRRFGLMNGFLLGLLLVTAGCGGGGGGSLTGPSAGPSLYVTQDTPTVPSTVLQFSATTNGTVSPSSTLTVTANVVFSGLAVDGAGHAYVGGEIFGSGGGSGGPPLLSVEILVYAPGASGTHPTRTITSTCFQGDLGGINGLTLDSSGNLYVSAVLAAPNLGSGIAVFSPAANGSAVPARTIGGSTTTIGGLGPFPIAVDSADNIYVSTGYNLGPESILVFNSSANGNVPPTSTIGGPTTTINYIAGLALDSAGNIYVSNGTNGTPALPEILEFSAGSTGDVAPARIISGSATTMSAIGNLALDNAGNIYVLNGLNVLKFAPNATGNVAPIATITTPTSLVFQNDIAVR